MSGIYILLLIFQKSVNTKLKQSGHYVGNIQLQKETILPQRYST